MGQYDIRDEYAILHHYWRLYIIYQNSFKAILSVPQSITINIT